MMRSCRRLLSVLTACALAAASVLPAQAALVEAVIDVHAAPAAPPTLAIPQSLSPLPSVAAVNGAIAAPMPLEVPAEAALPPAGPIAAPFVQAAAQNPAEAAHLQAGAVRDSGPTAYDGIDPRLSADQTPLPAVAAPEPGTQPRFSTLERRSDVSGAARRPASTQIESASDRREPPKPYSLPKAVSAAVSALKHQMRAAAVALAAVLFAAQAACGSAPPGPELQAITAGQTQSDISAAVVSQFGTWAGTVGDWNHDASFKVYLPQPGTLAVNAAGIDGAEFDLQLLNTAGQVLGDNDNTTDPGGPPVEQLDLQAGSYYVILHNNNNGGVGMPYSIDASFTAAPAPPADNGPFLITAAQIQNDMAAAGPLSPGTMTGIVAGPTGDLSFKLPLTSAGSLSLSLSAVTGAEFDLILLDSKGEIIGRSDDTTTPDAPGWVQNAAEAGTYYVILHNNNNGGLGSAYSLTSAFAAAPAPAAYPITASQVQADLGLAVPMTLGASNGTVGASGTDAVYSLQLAAGGQLALTLDGVSGVEFDLLLVDSPGSVLAEDDNTSVPGDSGSLQAGLSAGTYYVIVHNNNNAGAGGAFTLNAAYDTTSP